MRIRHILVLVSVLIGTSDLHAQKSDLIDAIAKYFRSSDSSKMSDEFSSTVQLNILSEESVYSKAQAEQIMRDFFSKNKPLSVKIIHRLTSNPNYKLAVFSMATAKEKFRISITLSSSGNRFLIKEMRIEDDKQ